MRCIIHRVYLALLLAGFILVLTACGPAATPEDIAPMTIEAQAVPATSPASQSEPTSLPTEIPGPESSPTNSPELAPTGLPTEIPGSEPSPTNLPNEISEPVSPLVPPAAAPMPDQAGQAGQRAQAVPGSEAAAAAVIADLSKQTGLPPDQINVDSVTAMEWSDASLGCPQEGMMYAQVITPGYLIMLSAQGQTYEYHTDQKTNVIQCTK